MPLRTYDYFCDRYRYNTGTSSSCRELWLLWEDLRGLQEQKKNLHKYWVEMFGYWPFVKVVGAIALMFWLVSLVNNPAGFFVIGLICLVYVVNTIDDCQDVLRNREYWSTCLNELTKAQREFQAKVTTSLIEVTAERADQDLVDLLLFLGHHGWITGIGSELITQVYERRVLTADQTTAII